MSGKKVVVLDGRGDSDHDLAPVLSVLVEVLGRDGAQLEIIPLQAMKLAHCIGCFDCWLKTPGMCFENDGGRQIARTVIQSDAVVLFTPVTFGGYSAELKRIMERFVQLISPYFQIERGEVHHPPRYACRPRMMMVGVQRHASRHEAHIFRTVAGRNAINFHPPSFAAEVVTAADDIETLQQRFEAMVGRSDALPFGEAAAALMPDVFSGVVAHAGTPKRALLINGSPRTKGISTSSVIGNYLLERLRDRGWGTESLTLRANLHREAGEAELRASINNAGLILLVFPLYADALPYLVTKALGVIAAHRRRAAVPPSQRLAAIVNSGFPETRQNAAALAICEEFARQSGIGWAGGLALPAGGMIGSEPLTAAKRSGPPVPHVIRALDLTAEALAQGRTVPLDAVKAAAKSPISFVPAALWVRFYSFMGGRGMRQLAAKNGVAKSHMLDQPYAA